MKNRNHGPDTMVSMHGGEAHENRIDSSQELQGISRRSYSRYTCLLRLAIKGLGQFEQFKAANAFRQLIEAWHVSDFHISSARGRKEASGESEHLSEAGDNLPRVALYLYEQHPDIFQEILENMAGRVPGINKIEPLLMSDGYLTLKFQDGAFHTPFLDRYVSDGTIKMFAYLVLLYDPSPDVRRAKDDPQISAYMKDGENSCRLPREDTRKWVAPDPSDLTLIRKTPGRQVSGIWSLD